MAPAANTPPKLLPVAVAISLALHALIVAMTLGRGAFPEARHEAEVSIDMPFAGRETEVTSPLDPAVSAATVRDAPPERLEPVVPQLEALRPPSATAASRESVPILSPAQPGDLVPALPPPDLVGKMPDLGEALRPEVPGLSETRAQEQAASSAPANVAADAAIPEAASRDAAIDVLPPARVQAPQAAAATDMQSAHSESAPALPPSIPPLRASRSPDVLSDARVDALTATTTPVETLAALTPPTIDAPEHSSVISAAVVDAFLARYDGGTCFSATRAGTGPRSATLDVFSPSIERIVALHNAFATELGAQPDVLGQHVWSGQCSAVDFLHRARPASGSPTLHVMRRRLQAGEMLAGEVQRETGDEGALYWVRETGAVVDLTSALVWSGSSGTFNVPAPVPSSGVLAPEMLVFISGADLPHIDTSALSRADPTRVAASGVLVLVGPP